MSGFRGTDKVHGLREVGATQLDGFMVKVWFSDFRNNKFRICLGLLLLGLPFVSSAQQVVSPEKLMNWLNTSEPPLLLDIRGHEMYMTGTIMGAVDAGLDPQGYLLRKQINSIVLITSVPSDRANIRLWIKRLDIIPDGDIYLLQGGIDAWQAAGFPLEKVEEGYAEPGTVPFVVPKGLCEMEEPAQRFE